MTGNLLLAIGLICFLGSCSLRADAANHRGGHLAKVSAFLASARPLIALPLAGVILGIFLEQAIAQTTTPTAIPTLRETLTKLATDALTLASPLVLAWLGWKLNQWFGLKQEEQMRAAFQTALENAAGKMVQATGSAAQTLMIGSAGRNKALAEGLAYVQQAAPDAIAFFKLTGDDLVKKLEAKIGLIVSGAAGTTEK
jgi:hypothetical protein